MTRLVLVRHLRVAASHRGLWVGGGTDPDADEAACAEARAPMRALARAWPPDAVWCSPLRRAQQTAALVGLPLVTDPRLTERDFGPWEGRPVDEVMADVPPEATEGTAAWLAYDPGGETSAGVAARVEAVWRDLRRARGCTWCVAHAGPLAFLRALALDITVPEAFDDALPHGGWCVIDAGGGETSRGRLAP